MPATRPATSTARVAGRDSRSAPHDGFSFGPRVETSRAGGYLRNGNGYINGGGAAHLQVLASAAEAMGATDLSTIGGPGKSAGDRTPFPGLRA